MDNSANSSINKALCSKEGTSSNEESGWTTYFEDFMSSGKKEVSGCCSSFWNGGSSSMVSDAASCTCAAWRSSPGPEQSKNCKKLSFKKRKARGILDDDPLEDTASSPVNSPKVADLNYVDMDPRKKGESQEKGIAYESYAKPRDEMNKLGFAEKTSDCTELKKRGLCLVPLSMFVEFLG